MVLQQNPCQLAQEEGVCLDFGDTDRKGETIYVAGYRAHEGFPIYTKPLNVEKGLRLPETIRMKDMMISTYEEVPQKYAKLLYEFLEGEYRSFEEYLTLIHKNLQKRS